MTKCKLCLLPQNVPGADLDARDVCSFCRGYDRREAETEDRESRKDKQADLEATLRDCRGKGRYDALVCLSGGKDSLYLLYKSKVEYGLNVLAFTTDVNIPKIAWNNIRRTIEKLGVDHLVYRPPTAFYRELFRYLLKNQEERGAVYTVSYVYAPLFEGDALAVAMEKSIPIVLAGYSPGQPEPERMVYEFSRKLICETDWTPPELKSCGRFSDSELARFWNPKKYSQDSAFPRYLAPFHAWDYNQENVMKEVVRLGLVATGRHASPIFSNYPINWLLMYSDLINFGYNPYTPEFSALIRSGKASRTYWRIMTPVVNFMIRNKVLLGAEVRHHLRWLGLTDDDLKVTLPRGAYDPVISH